jgi:hypothetical protein
LLGPSQLRLLLAATLGRKSATGPPRLRPFKTDTDLNGQTAPASAAAATLDTPNTAAAPEGAGRIGWGHGEGWGDETILAPIKDVALNIGGSIVGPDAGTDHVLVVQRLLGKVGLVIRFGWTWYPLSTAIIALLNSL